LLRQTSLACIALPAAAGLADNAILERGGDVTGPRSWVGACALPVLPPPRDRTACRLWCWVSRRRARRTRASLPCAVPARARCEKPRHDAREAGLIITADW